MAARPVTTTSRPGDDPPASSGAAIGLGITSSRVASVFLGCLVLLNVGNAVAMLQRPWRTESWAGGWLLLAMENNPSTWFTSVALLAAAAAVMALAATHPAGSTDRRRWRQLAVVPIVLSIDEVAEMHERLGSVGDALGGGSGLLRYGWVVAGALILVALAVAFGPFVLRQGRFLRNVLLLAAGVTVSGGIVVEALNGLLDEREAAAWIYLTTTTIEENFELLGIGIALVGIVHAAARRGAWLSFDVRPDRR